MNVNLGETLEQFVADLIRTGHYQSQSEVLREGLRLLKEREDLRAAKLAQLRGEIDKGLSDLENGRHETHDEKSLRKFFADSKRRGRRKLSGSKARVR
jgi:antitoxin ParD1/3/4